MESLIPNLIRMGVAILCFLFCLVMFNMLGWPGLISAMFAFYVGSSMEIETEEEINLEDMFQAAPVVAKE